MTTAHPELVTAYGETSPFAEVYRALRFNLLGLDGSGLWSLGVTGAAPGHGSTTTAANLALIMAESGIRVMLVDADLQRPSLHRHFELSNEVGFTTVLQNEIGLEGALQAVGDPSSLRVLTAGPLVRNPAALLQRDTLTKILDRLRRDSDFLVVDLPSVGAVAYTSFLASLLDGLLLVVRAGTSPVSADRIVQRRLQGVNVVGMVLNQVPVDGSDVSSFREYVRMGS